MIYISPVETEVEAAVGAGGDCDVYVIPLDKAAFYLVFNGQPVPPISMARALSAALAKGPAAYLEVYLGGGGEHMRARQGLVSQPRWGSTILVLDDVDLHREFGTGPVGPEALAAAERISDYYGMALAARGRWVEALASVGVRSERLVWVDRNAQVVSKPGTGELWVLPRSRAAARAALLSGLAAGAGPHEPSWPSLMAYADNVHEIRQQQGVALSLVRDLEYWVGAVASLRGLAAGADVKALSRQALPMTEAQAAAVAGGEWTTGGPDLLTSLSRTDSVAVVRWGTGGLRPERTAMVVSAMAGQRSVIWVELDSGADRVTRIDLTDGSSWQANVLRNAQTRAWVGPLHAPDGGRVPVHPSAGRGEPASEADRAARSSVVEAGGVRLDLQDFLTPRQSRAERWELYDRMLRLALMDRLTGKQVQNLTAGVQDEMLGKVDLGVNNAKLFAGVALLLDTERQDLAALSESEPYRDLLVDLSGCDVGPDEKFHWIVHMKQFGDLAVALGRFGEAHVELLNEMTDVWLGCGGLL